MNTFDKGDLVRATRTFKANGATVDPTSVTLKVRDPSGSVYTYTYGASQVARSTEGTYYKDLSVAQDGQYLVRWESTGQYQSAQEGSFYVRPSNF